MNDEVKKILIDLIGYYNVIGTDDDPGFGPFADIVSRASKVLDHEAFKHRRYKHDRSGRIDPFAMDTLKCSEQKNNTNSDRIIKQENDW